MNEIDKTVMNLRMLTVGLWVVSALFVFIDAASPPEPRFRPHVFPPPEFKGIISADKLAELKAIDADEKLSWQEKHKKIDAVMSSLPDSVLERLPLPPGFEKLPKETQVKLRAAHKAKNMTWDQRHALIHNIIDSLPPEQKKLVHQPPPPPGFIRLPVDVQEKLINIHVDHHLTRKERNKKIADVLSKLPENLRKLVPPPPPI